MDVVSIDCSTSLENLVCFHRILGGELERETRWEAKENVATREQDVVKVKDDVRNVREEPQLVCLA